MSSEWEVRIRRSPKLPVETIRLVAEDQDKARRIARDLDWEVISVAPWSRRSVLKRYARNVFLAAFILFAFGVFLLRGCGSPAPQ
jgi:hypothetical protein